MKERQGSENMYLLSIIIPHYNSPITLETLLSSIDINDDIQTIVIDDHSDKYLEEYQELKSKYPDVLFLENEVGKKGAGNCRNIGLSNASGEWVLFADADDYFLPDWYAVVKSQMGVADIVFFPPVSAMLDTAMSGKRHLTYVKLINDFLCSKKNSEFMIRYGFLPPWSKLINKSIIEANDICFQDAPVSNDVMFSVAIGYYAKTVSAYNYPIYCVTESNSSLTKKISEPSHRIRCIIDCDRYIFCKTHISSDQFEALDDLYAWDAVKRLKYTITRGYGIGCFFSYLRMFKQAGVPFVRARWVKSYLYRHIRSNYRREESNANSE